MTSKPKHLIHPWEAACAIVLIAVAMISGWDLLAGDDPMLYSPVVPAVDHRSLPPVVALLPPTEPQPAESNSPTVVPAAKPVGNQPESEPAPARASEAQPIRSASENRAHEDDDDAVPPPRTPSAPEESDPPVSIVASVTLEIVASDVHSSFQVPIETERTVYEILKQASQSQSFSFDVADYGFGLFVEELQGVRNDPSTQQYWVYAVNGASANRGVSEFKVKPGDIITWNYIHL
jgi:hypothetical protein